MKYIVIEQIESPNKIAKNIEVFDLMFCLCYMAVSFGFAALVSEKLVVPFMIFSFLMAIMLTVKSPFNRNRRNFESIYFMLSNDNKVYKPIYNLDEKEDDSAKKEK